MSIEHLKQLRSALESNHWNINCERTGDEYRVSGYWDISRSDNSHKLTISFDGLDDTEVLPIEKAYACEIIQQPAINAYFGKIHKSWPGELNKFIALLNNFTK